MPLSNTQIQLLILQIVEYNSRMHFIYFQRHLAHPYTLQAVAGLAVSVMLALLSLASTISHRDTKNDPDISIDGTGILHTIWLYRNHAELETLLEQVEHPTDNNLRKAGMVRTSLGGGGLYRRKEVNHFD
jgi:hypothetical protein